MFTLFNVFIFVYFINPYRKLINTRTCRNRCDTIRRVPLLCSGQSKDACLTKRLTSRSNGIWRYTIIIYLFIFMHVTIIIYYLLRIIYLIITFIIVNIMNTQYYLLMCIVSKQNKGSTLLFLPMVKNWR